MQILETHSPVRRVSTDDRCYRETKISAVAAERLMPSLADGESTEKIEVPIRAIHSFQPEGEEMRAEGGALRLPCWFFPQKPGSVALVSRKMWPTPWWGSTGKFLLEPSACDLPGFLVGAVFCGH